MSSAGEVDLGVVANSMPLGKYKKKRRMDRRARDYGTSLVVRHTIISATSQRDFHIPTTGSIRRPTRPIYMIAISLFTKEQCVEMCQHIYNTMNVECNKVPLSIARMVYAKVELGKEVDWRTNKIQPKSLIITSTERFIPLGRKFPHGGLGKKMPKVEIDNTSVVWSNTSRDDEHMSCDLLERRQIESTIKEKMLENTLNDMVDNDYIQVLNL
jgi:hypothetical protein